MKKHKNLVVDDDNEICNAVINLLNNENYEAFGVSNGSDALQRLNNSFDLIVLDIMMHEKDGISTYIDVRKKYVIPILFLTAKNMEYDKY